MLHREIHGFWGTPVVVSQETPNFKQLQVELVDEAGNYLQQLRPQMGGLGLRAAGCLRGGLRFEGVKVLLNCKSR